MPAKRVVAKAMELHASLEARLVRRNNVLREDSSRNSSEGAGPVPSAPGFLRSRNKI